MQPKPYSLEAYAMKLGREEGFEDGFEDGFKEGFREGLKEEFEEGCEKGFREVFKQEFKHGFKLEFEQGFKQGFIQGREGTRFIIAKNLLAIGIHIDKITQVTGLSKDKILLLSRKV
ncbi:MAG: hypothetical protein LBU12_07620 [Deltaproteobacteria bacterium]|jgi:flagellar biosynthesis/type III secretory pathway protein FliH|nr:hypothetical protein [Deltaproteobacteria bacterium]